MDGAYWIAAGLGIVVAGVTTLVSAGFVASAFEMSRPAWIGSSIGAGVLAGALVCVLMYWFLFPFSDRLQFA